MRYWILCGLMVCGQLTYAEQKTFFRAREVRDASVLVRRLNDGQMLHQSKSQQLMTPASVTKLMTTAALLDFYGPGHQFETEFFYTGQKRSGVVHGDLVIRGGGDPHLVSEDLWQIAADIHHMGIRRFTGRIVVDNSKFQTQTHSESRKSGMKSSEHAWDAPISAFGVNFNTVAVSVAPAERVGHKAIVHLDPYSSQAVEIKNQVQTSKSKTQLQVWRETMKDGRARIHAKGYIAQSRKIRKFYRSIYDPVRTSGEFVRSFFQKAGVIIEGQVVEGAVSREAHKLYVHKSDDLGHLIRSLNLHSSNYIADVLVANLGCSAYKNSTKGVDKIHDFLKKKVGLDTFHLQDGSGLSVQNRLSAVHIVGVLEYMSKQPSLFPEYLASLPASARSGTLKDRFSVQDEGKIRAKTGTLTEPDVVSSLAGYVQHPRQGWLAFAVLHRGQAGNRSRTLTQLRKLQDAGLKRFISTL